MNTSKKMQAWGNWMLHSRNVGVDADVGLCVCGCAQTNRFLLDTPSELDRGEVAVEYCCPICERRWVVYFRHVYGGENESYVPFRRMGLSAGAPLPHGSRRILTDHERWNALDALAAAYSRDVDAGPIVYSYWYEPLLTESDLVGIEAALSLFCVKDKGDWREAMRADQA